MSMLRQRHLFFQDNNSYLERFSMLLLHLVSRVGAVVVVAYMAKWKPAASLHVWLFFCFSKVIRKMKWNKIRVLHSLQGPCKKKKKYIKGQRKAAWQHVSLRNIFVSTPRINSGAIWKSYLAHTCFSWEKHREKKRWLSLISWASLTPAGSYNVAVALSPWSKADTHPLSARSTDCHSSCQSSASVPWSPRVAEERQELRMEGDDDEGLRRGGRREGKESRKEDRWGWGRLYAS